MWTVVKWVLCNAVFAGFLVAGTVYGVGGAINVSIFYIWYLAIVSCSVLSVSMLKTLSEKKSWPSVPAWLDLAFDVAALGLLVWTQQALYIHSHNEDT